MVIKVNVRDLVQFPGICVGHITNKIVCIWVYDCQDPAPNRFVVVMHSWASCQCAQPYYIAKQLGQPLDYKRFYYNETGRAIVITNNTFHQIKKAIHQIIQNNLSTDVEENWLTSVFGLQMTKKLNGSLSQRIT